MRKVYILLIIIIFSSCGSYRIAETYKRIAIKGYAGLKYCFSDSGNRNLEISIINDSTLNVVNKTDIAQTFFLLSFNCVYSYTILDIANIKINKMVYCDKKLSPNRYIKPYNYKQYNLDNDAAELVFPDVTGDTIRFSTDFKKLQIKEFCFQLVKNR